MPVLGAGELRKNFAQHVPGFRGRRSIPSVTIDEPTVFEKVTNSRPARCVVNTGYKLRWKGDGSSPREGGCVFDLPPMLPPEMAGYAVFDDHAIVAPATPKKTADEAAEHIANVPVKPNEDNVVMPKDGGSVRAKVADCKEDVSVYMKASLRKPVKKLRMSAEDTKSDVSVYAYAKAKKGNKARSSAEELSHVDKKGNKGARMASAEDVSQMGKKRNKAARMGSAEDMPQNETEKDEAYWELVAARVLWRARKEAVLETILDHRQNEHLALFFAGKAPLDEESLGLLDRAMCSLIDWTVRISDTPMDEPTRQLVSDRNKAKELLLDSLLKHLQYLPQTWLDKYKEVKQAEERKRASINLWSVLFSTPKQKGFEDTCDKHGNITYQERNLASGLFLGPSNQRTFEEVRQHKAAKAIYMDTALIDKALALPLAAPATRRRTHTRKMKNARDTE